MKASPLALAAALALLAATTSAARAGELVVIASTDSEIGVGSVLDGARAIQLADGNSVTLVSSDGRTLKLRGPYLGRPDPLPDTGSSGLLDALSDIVKPTENDVSTAGIMRSSLYAPKQPWVIDSGQSGAHCVLPGRPPCCGGRSQSAPPRRHSKRTLTRPAARPTSPGGTAATPRPGRRTCRSPMASPTSSSSRSPGRPGA